MTRRNEPPYVRRSKFGVCRDREGTRRIDGRGSDRTSGVRLPISSTTNVVHIRNQSRSGAWNGALLVADGFRPESRQVFGMNDQSRSVAFREIRPQFSKPIQPLIATDCTGIRTAFFRSRIFRYTFRRARIMSCSSFVLSRCRQIA